MVGVSDGDKNLLEVETSCDETKTKLALKVSVGSMYEDWSSISREAGWIFISGVVEADENVGTISFGGRVENGKIVVDFVGVDEMHVTAILQ